MAFSLLLSAGSLAILALSSDSALPQEVHSVKQKPVPPKRPNFRELSINLSRLTYQKEDDDIGSDEPYMISLGFKMTFSLNGKPNQVAVTVDAAGHDDIPYKGDDWASEGHQYEISKQGFLFHTQLWDPRAPVENYTLVGVFFIMMEADEWSESIPASVANRIKDGLDKSLKRLAARQVSSQALADQAFSDLFADFNKAHWWDPLSNLEGLNSAANPDDFGGVNMVVIQSGTKDTVRYYAGPVPKSFAAVPFQDLGTVAGPTVRRIRLTYPAGDLSSLASNKKYGGKCVFDGTVRRNY